MILAEGFLLVPWLVHSFNHSNVHVAHGLIVLVVLFLFGWLFKQSLGSIEAEVQPNGKANFKSYIQVLVESLYGLFKGIIPHHTEDYLPLLGSVFIYIFVSNLLGLFPGLLPPTENLNTNYAVALSVFVYYHYCGCKRVGFQSYWAHFMGPSLGSSWAMFLLRVLFFAPLMFVIEIVSHSVRPLSLSLRLFGNIYGDHQVLSVFSHLTEGKILFFVPVVFLAFGIFVAFVQAFVFTLLSAVYIGLAVETHDEHHTSHGSGHH